ncbi:N-acetylneuraminate synthase family protein [bacterium]|nr:N-acetylneuraminate synthase family protein [bacterium]
MQTPNNFPSPYIIAEIGVNHEGSLDLAKKLIMEAKIYEFDSVKLQHIVPGNIWHESVPSDLALSNKEALPDQWLEELVIFAHQQLLEIGCTPTFQGSAKNIKEAGCDFIKVASPQSKYDRFILDEALETGLPLIISNGYCDFRESLNLIEYLATSSSGQPIAFLYCVAKYPSDNIQVCMKQIDILSNTCLHNSMAFGLSDHNQSMYQSLLFKNDFRGTIFEKHFSSTECSSLDRDVSIHSWQAREYVRQLKLPIHDQSSMRDETLSDKTNIFSSSFFLNQNVHAGEPFFFVSLPKTSRWKHQCSEY